jgi:tetratricopeptide (TPR) repeat protein
LNLDSDVIEHIEGGPRNKQLNHHGLQSLTLDIRLSKGIGQVNRGNYEEAISIFDMLLEENPKSCDALLGRGTAYAFLRNLEFAITDFSKVQMPESKFLLLQGSSSLLECIETFISQGSCCNCCNR